MKDHCIICGFGVKGRGAVKSLLGKDVTKEKIVIIDADSQSIEEANRLGYTAILGNASRTDTLERALIHQARAVIVATDRDDTSVLVTLTARELNPKATIVASVREEENVHLLRQSGADSVITSAASAGKLLGLASQSPKAVDVIENIISTGQGIDIIEREIKREEIGPRVGLPTKEPIVAVIRDDKTLRFDDPAASELKAGDKIVYLCAAKADKYLG